MFKKFTFIVTTIVVFGLFQSGPATAAPVITPIGLNPGDTYRLVFVTSTTTTAASSDINFYNNFVNTLGFAATGSTASVDARDNTNTNPTQGLGTAIYLLDGSTKVAENNVDLWNRNIAAAINLDETGSGPISTTVHAGTFIDGMATAGFSLGDATSSIGSTSSSQTGSGWIFSFASSSNVELGLYGISGILTVAEVPEPASLALFALGFAGIVCVRRRKIF
jgi:hypothetical protein